MRGGQSENGIPEEDAERRLEAAVDWLLRLRDGGADAGAVEQEFLAWLGADPRHEADWQKACRSWTLMGEALPQTMPSWPARRGIPAPEAALPEAEILDFPPRRRGRIAALIAVAAVAAFAFIAGPAILTRMEADHYTRTAELRHVTLEDGSEITLGARSAIAVDMTGEARRLRLLEGEAWFDIAHDSERPFIVTAGELEATVLGTAFSVSLGGEETRIELAEGALKVSLTGEPVLAPGDSLVFDHQSGAVRRDHLPPEDIGAWREGRIFVNDQRLSTVVDQIRRYHPGWVTIADASLGEQRVTGLYDLGNPDRALRALVQPWGGTVREVSPWMVVLSRW